MVDGKAPPGSLSDPRPTKFVEGSGRVMNTIPPNAFFLLRNAQTRSSKRNRPRRSTLPGSSPDLASSRASRSIPASASSGAAFYPDTKSNWSNPLFVGGYQFMDPAPEITKEEVKPFASTGARTLDGRTSFFYLATVITPAMVMRPPNIGSQYLGTFYDAKS